MPPDFATGVKRSPRPASALTPIVARHALVRHKWWQRKTNLGKSSPLKRSAEFAATVLSQGTALRGLSAEALGTRVRQLRAALDYHGVTDTLAADAFALVREVTSRRLGLSQHATQIIAARIMLDNQLAEMAPGEGKTLAIVLAAATVALAGMPVHVVLAHDHLTLRDATMLNPVFEALGLTVGMVVQTSSVEDRRFEYTSDVTYCTAGELAMDYLRDCLALGSDAPEPVHSTGNSRASALRTPLLLLRGFGMAIIDDAERILLDAVGTPLILSQRKTDRSRIGYYWQARLIADGCRPREDFVMDADERNVSLTGSGMLRLDNLAKKLDGLWRSPARRERLVALALAAKYLYHRDFDYVVRNARVFAIDPDSGRVCGPRIWPRGLLQLIELKEGCEVTGDQYVGAQTSYAELFTRFTRLAGTGSALHEARHDLQRAFGLNVTQVPPRRESRRTRLPLRVYCSRAVQRAAVVARARRLHEQDRAVVIRTHSIAESEKLSVWLTSSKLPHTVLHGHDAVLDERNLLHAGTAGSITVVSQSAGAGSHITPDNHVAKMGGVYLINCALQNESRTDRVSEGWCARRGAPGTAETILCLQLEPLQSHISTWAKICLRILFPRKALPGWLGQTLLILARRKAARQSSEQRRQAFRGNAPAESPCIVTSPRRPD